MFPGKTRSSASTISWERRDHEYPLFPLRQFVPGADLEPQVRGQLPGNPIRRGVKNYRFELFYWDYAVGIFLVSLILAFTMGSTGNDASSFLNNVSSADT